MAPPPSAEELRIRRFRRWAKSALWASGGGLLLLGVAVFGLRYGFVSLPSPPPGFRLPYPPPEAVAWDQATNGWAAIRACDWLTPPLAALGRDSLRNLFSGKPATLLITPEVENLDPYQSREVVVTQFTQFCHLAKSNSPALARLEARFHHPADFATLLTLPDKPPPERSAASDFYSPISSAMRWAWALAGQAVEQKQPEAAMDYVGAVFTLEAAVCLIEKTYTSSWARELSRQACLLDAPLDPERGRQQLAALDQTAHLLPSLEALYAADVRASLPRQEWLWGEEGNWRLKPNWGRWGGNIWDDLVEAGANFLELGSAAVHQISGNPQPIDWPHLPVNEWLIEGWIALARQVTRPADCERVLLADASKQLDLLPALSPPVYPQLRKRYDQHLEVCCSGASFPWWHMFSQPVAWICYHHRPFLYESALYRGGVLRDLAVCRLLLALRLSRDASGHWPDRLTELVPAWLPELPAGPLTGQPFHYRRHGSHWVLWLSDQEGRHPNRWTFDGFELWSAPSVGNVPGTVKWRTRLRQQGSKAFFRNTPDLPDLLPLLPEGADKINPESESTTEGTAGESSWPVE